MAYIRSVFRNKVTLTIYGQAIDENYSKILIQRSDLDPQDVINLDRVQEKRPITDFTATELRRQKLIEGRKPNYFVGIKVAQITDKKAEYSKNKGMNKQYYLDFILQSIEQHRSMTRKDIDELFWKKLPDIYDDRQKKTKINHLISELRNSSLIENVGSYKNPEWVLVKG
jgi:ATP-dependent DNA helicase RecG